MNPLELKVLLVDDDEDDYIMTRDLLMACHMIEIELDWSSTYEDGYEAVGRRDHDVYLFDYQLGAKTGLELLRSSIDSGLRAPIILLTGRGDRETDLMALKAGAADYLNKDSLGAQLLERSIRYAVERFRAAERMTYLARYDQLTGLMNRSHFRECLDRACGRAQSTQERVALMVVNLDRFKAINDTIGHRAGDLLLQDAAERLKSVVQASDTVARLGGDEFIVLLGEVQNPDQATQMAERILGTLDDPFKLGDQDAFVSASIGITFYPDDTPNPEQLLKQADVAVFRAKRDGRNTYRFFSAEVHERARRRMVIQRSLRTAIERHEFSLHYQPIFGGEKREMIGAEALLRWTHPTLGRLQPAEFIPVLEETGLIIRLGSWVLRTVCKQIRTWLDAGFSVPRISVNLSPMQIQHPKVISGIAQCLEDSAIDPSCLTLELTEGLLVERTETGRKVLADLKAMGVQICIDDFGTGYASLNYLRRFPVDILKIDRAFLEGVPANTDDAAIISVIIALAHRLEIRVVAEGVETQEQLSFLMEQGCDGLQGFLLGKPEPVQTFQKRFQRVASTSEDQD